MRNPAHRSGLVPEYRGRFRARQPPKPNIQRLCSGCKKETQREAGLTRCGPHQEKKRKLSIATRARMYSCGNYLQVESCYSVFRGYLEGIAIFMAEPMSAATSVMLLGTISVVVASDATLE